MQYGSLIPCCETSALVCEIKLCDLFHCKPVSGETICARKKECLESKVMRGKSFSSIAKQVKNES